VTAIVRSLYPVTLVSGRVRLREFQPTDAAAALRWASDPAYFRYMSVEPASEADETEFLRDVDTRARTQPRVDYHLGIVERDDDDLIGIVRLSINEPEHRGADIGYGLRTDRWGLGYATEAARMLVGFGFASLGLHRIWGLCDPQNIGSRRVMEKIGMRQEGRFREHVFARGQWRDSLAFAILEREWHA
jgi:[ribosomal protein S5]-alanine N-acetyltransferase